MKAITCCCAPAPIDSIATTAATPKIIPSIVSSVRSLWRSRFSMLRPRSGSQSVEVIATRAAAPAAPSGCARRSSHSDR